MIIGILLLAALGVLSTLGIIGLHLGTVSPAGGRLYGFSTRRFFVGLVTVSADS